MFLSYVLEVISVTILLGCLRDEQFCPICHVSILMMNLWLLHFELFSEMSKSNNLLDSEEQHWQSTTNFAKRETGEMHLRNNCDVLNVNVRNLFWGTYTKRIFIKTGFSCNKALTTQDILTLPFV